MRAYIEHRLDQRPGVQKLYYMGPMFRRERPQKGRYRQFFQIGAEAIGSESPVVDAEVIEMVVDLLQRRGTGGFHAAAEFGGRSQLPAGLYRSAARGTRERGARACARIASGARPRIRCACWIARCPRISRSSTSCLRFWIICAKRAGRTFDAVQRVAATIAGFRSKSGRAWCAASITTCARRSRWCTGHWARRIRCSAADVTTVWRKRSGRRFLRRASDFRSARTGW